MSRLWTAFFICAPILAVLSGCAGARGSLTFDQLAYPASMSPYLVDRTGRSRSPGELEVVGRVKVEKKFWGMLYSWIPLTGRHDASQGINQQVRAVSGDGVVNLTVVSDWCGLNHIPLLPAIPLWPGCADVSILGKIVKIKAEVPPAAPPPAPPETSPPVQQSLRPRGGATPMPTGPALPQVESAVPAPPKAVAPMDAPAPKPGESA